MVQFLNRTMPYDRFTIKSLKEQTIGDPDYEPELSLLVKEKEVEGFILGVCRKNLAGIKVFSVRDGKNSLDIGSSLLEKLEERFMRKGIFHVKVGHIAPKYFQPGIDARYTTVVSILLRKGYQIVEGTGQNMEVDLAVTKLDTTKEGNKLKREGVIIRRLQEKDRSEYLSFLKNWGDNWFYMGMLAYENKPISCHIAFQNNKIVGFACHSVTTDHYFGPMATSPKLRGKGIGEVLLKRCLKDIKEMGEKKATILAVGPVYFYWKTVGARIPRLLWEMSKDLKKS